MSDGRTRRTRAEVRRSRWPGWIWAIPIAAVAITGWIGLQALARGGEEVTVRFDSAHGAKKGDTKVTLLGVEVGQVSDVRLDRGARGVVLTLRLDHDVAGYLRTGARFWMQGAEVSLSDPASLKSILAGPTIVMIPGAGATTRSFTGLEQAPAPTPAGPQVPYLVRFTGPVGDLKAGAPVTMRGFRVGEVTGVDLGYDARAGALDTPVRIELEPERLHISGAPAPASGDWRPLVDGMLRTLIAKGLRASLAQSPPLFGSRQVDLVFETGAPAARLEDDDGVPEIPATASSGLEGLTAEAGRVMGTAGKVMNRADEVMAKIDAMPFDRIGENVRATTARIRGLVSSPKIEDSLDHVDDATRRVDQAVRSAAPQVGPLVAELRRTADEADRTVAAADRLIGGDAESQDSDLPSALHELSGAARSIRVLADTLQRHPEALLTGKPKVSR